MYVEIIDIVVAVISVLVVGGLLFYDSITSHAKIRELQRKLDTISQSRWANR